MRFSRTSVLTILVAAAVGVGSTGIAQASEDVAPADVVAKQIAAVAPKTDAEPTLTANAAGATTEFPRNATQPVKIASADDSVPDIVVTLPALEGATSALQADDGTAVYESEENATLAVQKLADGATRFLAVLENSDAPDRYEYRFEGTKLRLEADGSAVALVNGQVVAVIDSPWAYDADGISVPTHYEVHNDALVQVVAHARGNFSYPIVADPKTTITWWNTTIYFNKAETDTVAVGGGGAAALFSRIPAVGWVLSAALGTLATLAAAYRVNGKCLKIVFYPTPTPGVPWVPQPYSGNEAGGYCR